MKTLNYLVNLHTVYNVLNDALFAYKRMILDQSLETVTKQEQVLHKEKILNINQTIKFMEKLNGVSL